jgi:protein-S-isoprenylcysteine O-methyltransferase Ste14
MMKKALPPTYFLLALVAMPVLHFVWPLRPYWDFPVNLAGLVPLVCGIVLNVLADRQFKNHQTTVKPFEKSSALITGFPFSFSRNPMYLGMTLMLLGFALLLGTVSPLVPVAAFAILMDVHFIRVEERMLADSFSHEWEQYRAQVRRWL